MESTPVLVAGLPGNVARVIARHALDDARFQVIPLSPTGPDISEKTVNVEGAEFSLLLPAEHETALAKARDENPGLIVIDYTHPTAVNRNAELYCRLGIPFVMGTTGGDREALVRTVEESRNAAVIAPNMAKEIVGFTAMMEYAAENFPGLFSGYEMELVESHQKGKADTSGTARAMVGYFNAMGVDFSADRIQMIREPEAQKALGVPEEHLGGHGWHTYALTSPDRTVRFSFVHNVNGRDVYYTGTADAVLFLAEKVRQGAVGRVFSMIEVLRG